MPRLTSLMHCASLLLLLPVLCGAAEPVPLRVVFTASSPADAAAGERAVAVVMRQAGLDYTLTQEPFERAVSSLKAGLYDVDAGRVDGFDKVVPGMQRVDPSLVSMTLRAYGRVLLPAPPSLAGQRIARVRGQRAVEDLLPESGASYAVDVVVTPAACLGMAAAGRVDYCVLGALNPPELDAAREQLQVQVLNQTPLYMWVGPGREALAQRLSLALRSAGANGDLDRALLGQRAR